MFGSQKYLKIIFYELSNFTLLAVWATCSSSMQFAFVSALSIKLRMVIGLSKQSLDYSYYCGTSLATYFQFLTCVTLVNIRYRGQLSHITTQYNCSATKQFVISMNKSATAILKYIENDQTYLTVQYLTSFRLHPTCLAFKKNVHN